jgi:hypothetical protein
VRQVNRYEVPVDDQPHGHELSGSLLGVAAQSADVVEFWAEAGDGIGVTRQFRVFDTGQPIPDDARWVGTTSGTVLHLYEVGVRLAVAPPEGAPQ